LPHTSPSVAKPFKYGDRVRLIREAAGHEPGEEGLVVGRYTYSGTLVVRFEDETATVRPDALEPADEPLGRDPGS
jgi:hypothetical protein